jgi:DNA-binding winged helix-turn-helix (wHTH) protein
MALPICLTVPASLRARVELAFRPAPHSACAAMLRRAGLVAHLLAPGEPEVPAISSFFSLRIADDAELPSLLPDDRADLLHGRWDALFAIVDVDSAARTLGRLRGRVSEWLFAEFAPEELVFRVLALLHARRLRSFRLAGGAITFAPDTRSLYFGEASVRLSPSEFEVAELFFDRCGTVIALHELVTFFEQSGKSAAMNNIRVTIFQLRLKLEELTRSQVTIDTVYRRGYVLRQAVPNPLRRSERGRELLATA